MIMCALAWWRDLTMPSDERLKELAISANGFVFDPHSGGTFTLNASGQAILKGLRDGLTPDQIAEQLRVSFDDVTESVVSDVHTFLSDLARLGLLSQESSVTRR